MFDIYRDDATQELFSECLRNFSSRHQSCYWFMGDGVLILSSDPILVKILENNMGVAPKEIRSFDFGGLCLDPSQRLSGTYNCGLFFKQGACLSDCGYGASTTGNDSTIILSDSGAKLSKFVKPVFDKHIKDFNIDVNSNFPLVDPIEPMLYVRATVNNRELKGLENDGCYCSRLLFKFAVDCLVHNLNNATNNSLDNQRSL